MIVINLVLPVVVVIVIEIFLHFCCCRRRRRRRKGNYVRKHQNAAFDGIIDPDVGSCKNEAGRERSHVPLNLEDSDSGIKGEL